MFIKALAAAATLAVATAIGQWMEYPIWGIVLGLASVFAMAQAPSSQILSMTLRQKAGIRRDFHFLELTAWFGRPAVLILDKERPDWTRSEMRVLFQSMNVILANHNGAEREVFTHLYRIAHSPHRPEHAYEKIQRQLNNRFTKKRAQSKLSEAILAASHMIARVNAPDVATAWLCVQADYFRIDPATVLNVINQHQKLMVQNGQRVAVVRDNYPVFYFPDNMLPPHSNSMRDHENLSELQKQIYLYRTHNTKMGVETTLEEYTRTMQLFGDLE